MSYSLNSLRGSYIGFYIWTTLGAMKGDTRSLDYDSYLLLKIPQEARVNGASICLAFEP